MLLMCEVGGRDVMEGEAGAAVQGASGSEPELEDRWGGGEDGRGGPGLRRDRIERGGW